MVRLWLLLLLGAAAVSVSPRFTEVSSCVCAGGRTCFYKPILVNNLLGAFDFERERNGDRTSQLAIEPAPLRDTGLQSDYGLSLLPKLHYRISLPPRRARRLTLGFWLNWQGGNEWSSLLWLDPEEGFSLRVGPDGRLRLAAKGATGALKSRLCRGALVPNRWTHFFVSLTADSAVLHLNGVKDSALRELSLRTATAVHLGRSDAYSAPTGIIDDLYIWAKAVVAPQLQLFDLGSFLPLAGATQLGCINCGYYQALRSCRGRYKLCTVQEMYAFAYQSATDNGWLRKNAAVWFYTEGGGGEADAAKTALCCSR